MTDVPGQPTHQVSNQPPALADINLFQADRVLQAALSRQGGDIDDPELIHFGQSCGSAEWLDKGRQANQYPPRFASHDRYGHRIDEVEFHPSYHEFMASSARHGLHSLSWEQPGIAPWLKRAVLYYLQNQVEAGHCCPITMTHACLPTLQKQPDIAAQWLPKILDRGYDSRNCSYREKNSVTIGMAMTEKQGGSDLRTNTTRAESLESSGPGQLYALTGHKFFVSAPMCDAFLTLAQSPGGLSCFLLPRWCEDGRRNGLHLQQLKDKMGNVSNATAEMELRAAQAWMIGEEGRGIANILQMVALTRYDCMLGSAGGMRRALSEVLNHCQFRRAFGESLAQQPLMMNLLADLALESEAAIALALRTGRALADKNSEQQQLLGRIAVAIGKFWICKRNPEYAYETMEIIGGMGVMENTPMPRLFRESVINSIWEGSGNVQALDMLRALHKQPQSLDALFSELDSVAGQLPLYDAALVSLKQHFATEEQLQYRGRILAGNMALLLQACTLLQGADSVVAEAFCRARLRPAAGLVYGMLPEGIDCRYLIERSQLA